MDIEIRTIEPGQWDAFFTACEAAFGQPAPAEDERASERTVSEVERSLAAFDGAEIVGTAGAFSFRLSAPGAVLPAAGVTQVGVKPTHRRRGVNTALMRRQLDDVHSRDEPVAILYASEAGIYGRFGYGLASFMCSVDIETSRAGFVRGYRPTGRVRLLERAAALEAMRRVYDGLWTRTPGMIERSPEWWEYVFADTEHRREGASPAVFAVHESEGEPDAYAAYRLKHDWPEGFPMSTLSIEELIAATPQAYADMWRYCFDVDLMHRVRAWNQPIDDPLLYLLAEPRRLRFTVRDGLFARLVDVPPALAGRRYAASDRITIEVRDDFCPWNDGRYDLEGGPDGAECGPTTKSADLVVSATDLGAAYLGGAGFPTLARAGRVIEETPGALRRADAMFRSDPAPWCPNMF